MPEKKIYSHSKLDAFEKCQLKYKYRYIDKIIPEVETNIEAYLGDIVHKTLDWLYKQVINEIVPTIEETAIYYSKVWRENMPKEGIIINNKLTEKEYFDRGVQFILEYYLNHQPFNDNTLETEKEIFIQLGEEGKYHIKGFIDRLSHNLKTGEFEIHDYKTGSYLPSKEKFENDRQLAIYSLAIKKEFGDDKKICLVWHYLAHDIKICSSRTNEQLEKLKIEILNLIKIIENTEKFNPTISKLCNWCEYKTMCEAWKK